MNRTPPIQPDHTDEQLLGDALRRKDLSTPDLAHIAVAARRAGGRIRRRRQALVCVGTVTVVGLGSVGLSLLSGATGPDGAGGPPSFAGAPTTSASAPVVKKPTPAPTASNVQNVCDLAPTERDGRGHVYPSAIKPDDRCGASSPPVTFDLSTAYAVLNAPGWRAPHDNVIADDKLYYTGPDAQSLVLNWRPADTFGPKYAGGTVVGTTTLDGDPAEIHETPAQSGYYTVVAPVRDGRFLTLSTTTSSLDDVKTLATQVHRTGNPA